jgi:glutaredoxin-like protein
MTLQTREGQRVPDVTLKTRENGEWKEISTADYFAGRNIVVFSLPGAFTPTCSSSHLPRYEELYPVFAQAGVDEIACVSVNDAFVMEAWARDQHARHVRMLPDGNGLFTDGMGMLVDKADLGFGPRSWRYSMYVKDGVIEKMFIEPEKPGDPFEVSDADTMLSYLNPGFRVPKSIAVFSKPGCPHCVRAKKTLKEHGLGYEEIVLGRDATVRSLRAVSGAQTTPQIFVDGTLIGGADQLEEYLRVSDAA